MAAAVVQSASGATFSGTSAFAVTFASNPTAGDTLLLAVACPTANGLPTSVTSTGDTWALVKSQGTGSTTCQLWAAPNIAGGSGDKTVTVHFAANTFGCVVAYELSGMPTTVQLDQFSLSAGTYASGSITPTANGEVIVAVVADTVAMTHPGGLWSDPQGVQNNASTIWLSAIYQVQGVVTAVSATFGGTPGSGTTPLIIVSLKAIAAVGNTAGILALL